ncbi:TRAPP trafficking subunit Trs65-domain-containing protein [Astrocystis sublimbata]|nr:TRAPP trafficking subunit Trs65-domain-containing protein [Astrocystis sublimbata]
MGDQPPLSSPEADRQGDDLLSLNYFIPRATDFKPDQVFRDGGPPLEHFLDTTGQRESLFFDESVDVVLVLRIPHGEGDSPEAIVGSLAISLEAQVVNGHAPDHDGSLTSEVIYNGTVDGSKDSALIIHDSSDGHSSDDEDLVRCSYAIWKKSVFLSRPRIRLQNPSAVFVATASLRTAASSLSDEARSNYMPSGMASSINLLGSFGSDPALGGVAPRLSAMRVSRVAPLTQQASGLVRPIKSLPQLSLRVFPAVHSRIKFTHPNTTPATATVIAMLELDFTPFFDCEIILNSIALTIPEAVVEDLTGQAGLSLPLSCVSHDHVSFIYRIVPVDTDIVSQNLVQDLHIAITATAMVNDESKPRLEMAWTAVVDFTVPVNPGYGPTMQPIQRAHRPSQLSIGGESTTSFTAPSIARPDALPSLEASTTQLETAVPELGITVTFTAPPPTSKISVGDEFSWGVFVTNQSPNQSAAARKLAMAVIPRRRRNESRVNRPPSVSRPPLDGTRGHSKLLHDRNVAEAILDDNVVHAMQGSSVVDNAELVCLSVDVRIGPLVPGTCHAAELRFLALKEGIVGVDAVRLIDLSNNEHVDIRELPNVRVEKRVHP